MTTSDWVFVAFAAITVFFIIRQSARRRGSGSDWDFGDSDGGGDGGGD